MKQDLRETVVYQEAEELYREIRQPGSGQISDAAEVHASSDGSEVVFTGTVVNALQGTFPTRVCHTDLNSGATRILTRGPHTDRSPKLSPDGNTIAFLSDRHRIGDFQLHVLDRASAVIHPVYLDSGWVEYFHWSPDGRHLLLAVAGHGADVAGTQGAMASRRIHQDQPAWLPKVDTGTEDFRWRSLWLYQFNSGRTERLSTPKLNIWEATWCGNERIAAIVSPGPGEGLWYTARLIIIGVDSGEIRELYEPQDQLGSLACSASGHSLAVVEAVSSDRGLVAGDLRLINVATGNVRPLHTDGVNVSSVEWRGDEAILLVGLRGFQTVTGVTDAVSGAFTEHWASSELSSAGSRINICGLGDPGDCVLITESFVQAPEIAMIRGGQYRTVKSFDLGYSVQAKAIRAVQPVTWAAPDGLDIQGWLIRPKSTSLHALIMNVHGGPVSHWRPTWLGRPRGVPILMLLQNGYAVFLPNPRGSSGRDQAFSRLVVGDMGGADTFDLLSGLDHLIRHRLVDARRLGVMGISYGGYMSAWLITQDARFAAAVAISPVSNHVTEHLISNLPDFVRMFLGDTYTNPHGKYFQRSPVMHAHKVTTPTLSICGALDRCTPPEEALQFHNALLENHVKSLLVTYPEEGHGPRQFPASIDYAARVVNWFQEHIPNHV